MAKVYISSSYIDLREERRAVADVLIARGHLPVGMEFYRASDEPPLEVCIRDVERCDLYIGIFAFRYGSVLGGNEKCITEMEYDAAEKRGIKRFIFLLKDDAPWPIDRVDTDRSRINAWRGRLKAAHIAAFFSTPAELAGAVKDVIPYDYEAAANQVARDIEWQCDRMLQEDGLDQAIQRLRGRPRPMVVVVHGYEREGHDKFREKVTESLLPRLLAGADSGAGVVPYHAMWPAGAAEPDQFRRMLRRALSQRVLGRDDGGEPEIQRYLARLPAPAAVYSFYGGGDDKPGQESIAAFLDYWKSWPELAPGQLLMALLLVRHRRKERGVLARLRVWDAGGAIHKLLRELQADAARAPIAVLPELHSVSRAEAWDWANRDDVRCYRPVEQLVEGITEIYQLAGAECVPLEDLAPKLRLLLGQAGIREAA